ncbi:hypothetical protein SteCoe_15253 [Stentor coeruleus]|uniref:Condensin complex subunit 1 C-terminal domain-containing protein n=1 Tax=Stentor coeruleus TaxID=5963 RepID=A0A1R2C419_9CILI|nr:hypothetical protein SteCoe_15253 [Stentor coeruleus]
MLGQKSNEMEFSASPYFLYEGPFLDKDDINGPGFPLNPEAPDHNSPQADIPVLSKANCMRKTGDKSIDFALYKISQFSLSPDLSERVKFTKELDDLALQLGAFNAVHIFSILQKLVIFIKVEDFIEVRIELGCQIGSLAKIFVADFKMYDAVIKHLVPVLDKLLEDKNQDVVKAACESVVVVAEFLSADDRGVAILTLILKMLHDEEEESRIRALTTLKSLINLLSSDLCESFILKEAMILASENTAKVRRSVAECIPNLSKQIQTPESFQNLISIFKDLSKDSIWGVRKACAENIIHMFEGLNNTSQELLVLSIYQGLLNDKSNSVRNSALLCLGPCICNLKTNVPNDIIDMYVELCKNISNKDFQYNGAYYFPGVLQKLGSSKWEKLSFAFKTMLTEGDFKAKKSLIAGLYVVGEILGPEMATKELSNIFEDIFSENSICKQVGLMTLSKFLYVILPEKRVVFLHFVKNLSSFSLNWRIRLAIAEQIREMIPLYDFDIVLNEFIPIAMRLVEDKVSKVRESAALSIGRLVNMLMEKNIEHCLLGKFREMSLSENYQSKLCFILACFEVIENIKFIDMFGKDMERMCNEKSSNVRLLCARVVKIGDEKSHNYKYWRMLKEKLAHDYDADVRYEIEGKYDVERGISKLRPNSEKHLQLMTPMFRALFPDQDLDEIITFNTQSLKQFGYLKASVTPAMNGFVECLNFESADKSKMLIFNYRVL